MRCRLVGTNRWLLAKQASIVDQYADYSSEVYAPLQRHGRFPDTQPPRQAIETEHFVPGTSAGLQALERHLPVGALQPRIKVRAASLCSRCTPRHVSRGGLCSCAWSLSSTRLLGLIGRCADVVVRDHFCIRAPAFVAPDALGCFGGTCVPSDFVLSRRPRPPASSTRPSARRQHCGPT